MKVMIDPTRLEKGMYVSELDRPWIESPFLFQGFRITNADELTKLIEFCAYVFVDTEKSAAPIPANISPVPLKSSEVKRETSSHIKPVRPYRTTFEKEFPKALKTFQVARRSMTNIFSDRPNQCSPFLRWLDAV